MTLMHCSDRGWWKCSCHWPSENGREITVIYVFIIQYTRNNRNTYIVRLHIQCTHTQLKKYMHSRISDILASGHSGHPKLWISPRSSKSDVFQGLLELDTIFLPYTTCMLLLHMCTCYTLIPTADPCAQTDACLDKRGSIVLMVQECTIDNVDIDVHEHVLYM